MFQKTRMLKIKRNTRWREQKWGTKWKLVRTKKVKWFKSFMIEFSEVKSQWREQNQLERKISIENDGWHWNEEEVKNEKPVFGTEWGPRGDAIPLDGGTERRGWRRRWWRRRLRQWWQSTEGAMRMCVCVCVCVCVSVCVSLCLCVYLLVWLGVCGMW